MRLIYTFVVVVLTPFVLIRLTWLGFRNPAYWRRWSERFGNVSWQPTGKRVIWIHAVSVGEVNAAKPIIQYILEHYPDNQLLLTTVTPTGAATVQRHFSGQVKHCYLPYDLPWSIQRFLELVQPSILITMETEIWPNLFQTCNELQIPVLVINARLSQKSAKGYQRVASLTKDTLGLINLIAAQTEKDADRFISLGADKTRVTVTGNLKFDIVIPQSVSEQAQSLKRYFSMDRPVWIAASTHEGEEEIVLQAHLKILSQYPDAVLIIAPRHPERAEKVYSLCNRKKLACVKRTDEKAFNENHCVYLLDTLGELQLHYAAAQIAFVGGSLMKLGGQNMMEPASLGLPVITGPFTYNFVEITELLLEEDILLQVNNATELAQSVCRLFDDANLRHQSGEKAQAIIRQNSGNIDRLMQVVTPYLSREDATNSFEKSH